MANEVHGQIDAKQKEIQDLKGPERARAEIKKYQETFINAVDGGQQDITTADGKLKSPEAKAYLETASQEILNHLSGIATKGQEIVKAEEGKEVPSLQDLSSKLQSELSALKPAIESFAILEEIEKKDLADIEKENEALNKSPGTADPSFDIYANKKALLEKLNVLYSKYPGADKSSSYEKKLRAQQKELYGKIDKEKGDLAIGPIARHADIKRFVAAATEYEKLVEEAKANPSIEAVNKAKAQGELIDPEKIFQENLAEIGTGSFPYINNLYDHLNGEYRKAKAIFEGAKNAFEYVEEEAFYGAAEKMLTDVSQVEEEDLLPTWKEYEPLSYRTDLKPEELEPFEAAENGLLSGYLTLKMTIGPFLGADVFTKFRGDTDKLDKRLLAKAGEIDQKIRQIEVNRQTRLSMAALAEVKIDDVTKENLLRYVTFTGEEKDGKIYFFNPSFESLSEEKQQKIRMAVESLIARDEGLVKLQTQKAMMELNKSTGNFDKISEVLGEKAQQYAEGLKLLSEGKHAEALKALQAYAAQSFTEEEAARNAGALQDAREKISLLSFSGDFFSGLAKYKKGDANEAAKLLASYIKKAEGLGEEDKKLHAEQLSQAKDIFGMISLDKVGQLDKLFADIDAWHQKGYTGPGFAGRGTGGYEVSRHIKAGIKELRKKITKGELVDFDAEFSKLKEDATAFREDGHGIGSSGLVEKFAEIYEGINTKDPQKKKEALVKFAKELREQGSYELAMEYLDKALEKCYRDEEREMGLSREGVMQKMMKDPAIMADIKKGADVYLKQFKQQFKKEHPDQDVPEEELRSRAEQMVFNARLEKQARREVRHRVTKRYDQPSSIGFGSTGGYYKEELELYNELAPYDPSVWWQPWTYSAEEWDNFKTDALEFVAITIATLPVGMGAGAIAKGVGSLAFRGLMRVAPNLLVRGGAAGAEAAILAIERGGIMTLRAGSAAFQALEPAVQRAVLQNRLLLALAKGSSGLASVATEGTLLLGGNTAVEGLVTGHFSDVTEASLVESIFKALAYRGVGMGGTKIFGKAIERGSVSAVAAMEAVSGLAGLGIDVAALYAQNLEGVIDPKFVLKSLLGNAIGSFGSHLGHGILFRPASKEVQARVAADKKTVEKLQNGEISRESAQRAFEESQAYLKQLMAEGPPPKDAKEAQQREITRASARRAFEESQAYLRQLMTEGALPEELSSAPPKGKGGPYHEAGYVAPEINPMETMKSKRDALARKRSAASPAEKKNLDTEIQAMDKRLEIDGKLNEKSKLNEKDRFKALSSFEGDVGKLRAKIEEGKKGKTRYPELEAQLKDMETALREYQDKEAKRLDEKIKNEPDPDKQFSLKAQKAYLDLELGRLTPDAESVGADTFSSLLGVSREKAIELADKRTDMRYTEYKKNETNLSKEETDLQDQLKQTSDKDAKKALEGKLDFIKAQKSFIEFYENAKNFQTYPKKGIRDIAGIFGKNKLGFQMLDALSLARRKAVADGKMTPEAAQKIMDVLSTVGEETVKQATDKPGEYQQDMKETASLIKQQKDLRKSVREVDPEQPGKMQEVIAKTSNKADRLILEKAWQDIDAVAAKEGRETLTPAEKQVIFEYSIGYLADFKAYAAKTGKEFSVNEVFGLIRDNQRKLAHQAVFDKLKLTGSDHGVTHLLDGNMKLAEKAMDDMHMSPEDRILVRQALIDHDMGYTMEGIRTKDAATGLFAFTKDHPIYSTLYVEGHRAMYEKFFGKEGYDIIHDAVLDHSVVMTKRRSKLDALKYTPGKGFNADAIRAVTSMVDCLGTTADVKTGTIYTHPEIIGSMQKLRLIFDQFSVEKPDGTRFVPDANKAAVKAQAQQIIDGMKKMLGEMDGVDQKTKDTLIGSIEASLSAGNFEFPVDGNLAMYGAGMKGVSVDSVNGKLTVDLVVDPQMQKAIRDSHIDPAKGQNVSVQAIMKAMGDFGFDAKTDMTPQLQLLKEGKLPPGQVIEITTSGGVKFRISMESIPLYEKARETFVRNNEMNGLRTEGMKQIEGLSKGYIIENGVERIVNRTELASQLDVNFRHVADSFKQSEVILPDGRTAADALVSIAAEIGRFNRGEITSIDVGAIKTTLDTIFMTGGKLQKSDTAARLKKAA